MATYLDVKHWRAIAGPLVYIPTVNSRVYYFPQGHLLEAASRPRTLSTSVLETPYLLCTVNVVACLADHCNDEVFASLTLTPLPAGLNAIPELPPTSFNPSDYGEKIVPFAKILTPSDLNNLDEFIVPLPCVETIFPLMEKKSNLLVRVLEFSDVHGRVWELKHVYSKRKKKHKITTGWREFVQSKRLVAGDTVVFMKYEFTGKMLIGTRRAAKERGKLAPGAVKGGMELAAKYEMFEVLYYPNSGRTNFVVDELLVEDVLDRVWLPGMRVLMALEMDASKIKLFFGKIYSIRINGISPWQGTLWRILQIKWDEPEVMKNYEWISPWQVVVVTPHLRTQEGEGGTPHPVWEKNSGEKLVDRLYFQCQSKSTAEDYYLGK